MEILGLKHVSIIVDDVLQACSYYHHIFGAIPRQKVYNFQTSGFSESTRTIRFSSNANLKTRFLEIPGTGVFLEILKSKTPKNGFSHRTTTTTNTSGIGHICFMVSNIEKYFNFINSIDEITLLTYDKDHQPLKITHEEYSEINFFNDEANYLNQIDTDSISNIKNFYFMDRYGVKWEFEE